MSPLVSELTNAADGLPAILELLRVLINVLDPNDQQHTDSTRLVALGILNSAFEESGHRISQFPSLEALVLDSGCKFLFQLARSENTSVLHLALRTISTVFDTMRQHLKLQQELFLAFTIDRLAPPVFIPRPGTVSRLTGASPRPGTPDVGASPAPESEKDTPVAPSRVTVQPARGETRDLILETLSQISRHPSFMVDLYTNYDCDVNCENVFERLIEFLTKVRTKRLRFIMWYSSERSREFIQFTLADRSHSSRTRSTCVWIFCWLSSTTWLPVRKG